MRDPVLRQKSVTTTPEDTRAVAEVASRELFLQGGGSAIFDHDKQILADPPLEPIGESISNSNWFRTQL